MGFGAELLHRVRQRLRIAGVPVGQRMDGGQHVGIGRIHRANHIAQLVGREWREVHDLERLRLVAEEPERACDVARREHEMIRRARQAGHQVAQHVAQPREVLEGSELERFVQQERHRTAGPAAGALEKRDERIERLARRLHLHIDIRRRERRCADDGAEEALGRGCRPLDIDVLAARSAEPFAQPAQEVRASRAAAAHEHGNSRRIGFESRQDATFEGRPRDSHDSDMGTRPAMGSRTPRVAATVNASG